MERAVVALGEAKRRVGQLRFDGDGRRQHSQFVYAEEWLEARDCFALSPALPLNVGGQYSSSSGSQDPRLALAGCFADAAPDSWGRALHTAVLGGGLTEFDFLVRSNDLTRPGALRFLDDDLNPLSHENPPLPKLVDLQRLRRHAHRFESDLAGAEEAARDLAGAAGALGGARPKANVQDDGGQLWIAKFTSQSDTRAIERVEVATNKLADKCGLRVSESRLELRDSSSPVALFRRFDRSAKGRIPYISARTALDWQREEGGCYSDIADVIRQISSQPEADLQELWRRVVFTILVSNRDDHLKNHGFLYVGGNWWRLSPAFDINPAPQRHRRLETGIIGGHPFDASLDIALEACACFALGLEEARRYASHAAQIIRDNWRDALKAQGAKASEIKQFRDAFEHEESEKALRLSK